VTTIRSGDVAFIRSGDPTLVKERNAETGRLDLETDPAKVRTAVRHGYLNGLTPENRKELYKILDDVKGATADPAKRAEDLRLKIDELKKDPRHLQLTRYLSAEMTHILNTYNIRPKEYSIDESQVR